MTYVQRIALLLCFSFFGCQSSPLDLDAAPRDGAAVDGVDSFLPSDQNADGDALTEDGCEPAPPEETLSKYQTLLDELSQLATAELRQARVDVFVDSLKNDGSYPLRDAQKAYIFWQGPSAPYIAGSFNGWQSGQDQLVRVLDTDLYVFELAPGQSGEQYKFVDQDSWAADTLNPHLVWDGIVREGIGAFNSVIPAWSGDAKVGRLERLSVASPQLGNTREVYVYLPPGYDGDICARYPLLLVNDGNESICRSHFDSVAEQVFQAKEAESAILVFVALADQNERMQEYSCEESSQGKNYADFLCDTLVPLIDQRYRSRPEANARGIIGASLGGLISYSVAFWRNDCLKRVGAQSGSFWYADNALISRVTQSQGVTLNQLYLDNGTDNRESTLLMRDALKAKGYSVVHWENLEQAHTWDAWQDRFDDALKALLPLSN